MSQFPLRLVLHYAMVGPPRLRPVQPISERMLVEGDTLRLACPVVATPRAIVTWEKDAVTVRPLTWERHRLTPDGLLLIVHDLEVSDSGSYVCRATNGFGTVQFQFQIKILSKFRFQIKILSKFQFQIKILSKFRFQIKILSKFRFQIKILSKFRFK